MIQCDTISKFDTSVLSKKNLNTQLRKKNKSEFKITLDKFYVANGQVNNFNIILNDKGFHCGSDICIIENVTQPYPEL